MKKSEKSGFYPILVNLQRFHCLVVGGGNVAYRKVLSLLEFNARITVISPRLGKPLIDLFNQNKIGVIRKNYSKEFIKNYKIVFCATDNPDINKVVREDCTSEGILLNVADNPPLCDFILPANVRRGDLTISVSSQGKAPFFTKEIKKKIDRFISPDYKEIFDLAGEFRKQVLKNKKTESIKSRLFKSFTSKNWEKTLSENRKRSGQFYIQKILREFNLF
jgi:precorrin-2 dehydrogenase/sirohydrochlorin ferrochelatase